MQGFGFATLPNTSATPETLWSTGSTTKAFTATALSLLIAGNNNSQLPRGWSTPISSIIPDDFVLQDEWATHHVTLDDAVSHRTGMPRHDNSIPQKIEGRPATVRDMTRNLRHLRPTFEPRVRWQYCNYMFAVLSHVIETVTGSHLEDVLRRHIWAPLGMNNTSFGARQGRKTPTLLSTGYYWNGEKYFSTSHDSLDTLSGIGAVVSSVLDYAKWLKCLTYQTAPFSEAVHRDIRQPRMLEPLHDFLGPDVETYGLGWSRTNLHGNVAYGHTGSTMSGGAIVTWLPELHFGVIIFANTATSSNNIGRVLAMRILEDRLNVRQDLRYKIAERYAGCYIAVAVFNPSLRAVPETNEPPE